MRRVALVCRNLKAPSFRLRLASLAPFAKAAGLELFPVVLPRRPEWLRVLRLASAFRSAAVVVFSKLKLLAGEDFLVRRWSPLWVFDVDDAVMYGKPKRHGDPPNRAWWRQRRFARMVRSCTLTVVASEALKAMVEPASPAVEVWPTPVDLRRYPLAHPEQNGELRLAWIGLGKNLRYLQDLGQTLRALAQRFAFRVVVISNQLPDLPGVPVELAFWDAEREGEQLASCHLGLAPLTDDLWTQGKGGYRCIQYAAAGLPCVASPVGANREVVVPGETGFWASTPEQWFGSLAALLEDPGLRRRLGAQARLRAQAHYDLRVLGPRYVSWLTRIAALRMGVGCLAKRGTPPSPPGQAALQGLTPGS